MNTKFAVFIVIVVIVLGGIVFYTKRVAPTAKPVVTVSTFEECAASGNPILESYPRQCKTPDGTLFTEKITTPPVSDLIHVTTPQANVVVKSPLKVSGEARGTWFFEASFPVRLLDANGKELAKGVAKAKGDWTTESFVPFEVALTFKKPTTTTGTLVLQKDNPSGLPEHDNSLTVPILFASSTVSSGSGGPAGCLISGCSAQVCSDKEVVTTCEYKAAYACYKNARCERQSNGQCGWTETAALKQCLAGR